MPVERLQAITNNDTIKNTFKNPEQGAATSVWAAIGKQWENVGGRYLADCEEAPLNKNPSVDLNKGYVEHAYNPELEARLWQDSLKIVGLA
jgi:hypothetical protein